MSRPEPFRFATTGASAALDKHVAIANTGEAVIARSPDVISKADIFILIAVVVAFVLGVYLFFTGSHEQGLFVATWVPAILCFGIYFKLMRGKR